jgi:transcriptional regulator with XRE-family HTH domain
MIFPDWLQEKRKEAGLTQAELAERAGASKQYISNLERNAPHPETGAHPRPKVEIVDAIARALGAPLHQARLAAGYAAPDETLSRGMLLDAEIEAMFRDYQSLSEEDKEELRTSLMILVREIQRRKALTNGQQPHNLEPARL